jgi:mRNA interferase MazF
MEVKLYDIVLCQFYFSDLKESKNRPVLVFKDNLPHDDFVGIPISSKIDKLYEDELLLQASDLSFGNIPKTSKLMIRKTFVISKQAVVKKYGTLDTEAFVKCKSSFCKYFGCTI